MADWWRITTMERNSSTNIKKMILAYGAMQLAELDLIGVS
jgi:hypothetical protein